MDVRSVYRLSYGKEGIAGVANGSKGIGCRHCLFSSDEKNGCPVIQPQPANAADNAPQVSP